MYRVGSGKDACDCIEVNTPKYSSPPYEEPGPNSNTFVRQILKRCGLSDPFAGRNPLHLDVPGGWYTGLSRDQVAVLGLAREPQPIQVLMKAAGRANRTKFRDQVLVPGTFRMFPAY